MDAVEDIKQRLSIEDVVSEYVELKRAGRNWKGLSPFTSERTPSLMVSPEKQIWHDFSSGKGGSMFGFVMEMEGVDFKEALEILARKAGVDLEQYRGTQAVARGKEKERLYVLLDLAAKFYQSKLKHSKLALDYLKNRQLTGKTIIEWRLGYSPAGGSDLMQFLKSKQFTIKEIKSAGLSAERYRGETDMFRDRLMIPLCDPYGRVIGFTARLLADNPSAPKYINTPQTWLYDKSRHIFGLHLAKDAIRKNDFVVVAEGNLDVVSSHQAGVRQVVATAGTALTEGHLKELKKRTDDIRLCFDADKAGLNATERAIPIAANEGVRLSIVTLPEGKDPDELIKHDVALWQTAIDKPQYVMDWLIQYQQKRLDMTAATDKAKFTDRILPVMVKLDRVEQSHYFKELMAIVGINQGTLDMRLQAIKQKKKELKKPAASLKLPPEIVISYLKVQDRFLSILLKVPSLRSLLADMEDIMFIEDDTVKAKLLCLFLREHPDFNADPQEAPQLQQITDYVKVLLFQYEQLYADVEPVELSYEATRLQARLIEQYVKMQKQRLVHRLRHANEDEVGALLEQVKKLDHLLKTHKGGA